MPMIFRDIKQHNKIYILDKNNMTIKEGIVTAVGIPQPNIEGKIVIDVTINVDDKIATYSIPEQLSITRANNLVLVINKEDLIPEIETMKTNAQMILDSIDKQKNILSKADSLLLDLNPLLKEKQQNEQRFSKIEDSLNQITKLMEQFNTYINGNNSKTNS